MLMIHYNTFFKIVQYDLKKYVNECVSVLDRAPYPLSFSALFLKAESKEPLFKLFGKATDLRAVPSRTVSRIRDISKEACRILRHRALYDHNGAGIYSNPARDYSNILPSVEIVTTLQGINFPLADKARLTAFSIPPQQGTSIRATVTLLMLLFARIAVSFSE